MFLLILVFPLKCNSQAQAIGARTWSCTKFETCQVAIIGITCREGIDLGVNKGVPLGRMYPQVSSENA